MHPSCLGGRVVHPSSLGGRVVHPSSVGGRVEHPSSVGGRVVHLSFVGGRVMHPSSMGGRAVHPSSVGGKVVHPLAEDCRGLILPSLAFNRVLNRIALSCGQGCHIWLSTRHNLCGICNCKNHKCFSNMNILFYCQR